MTSNSAATGRRRWPGGLRRLAMAAGAGLLSLHAAAQTPGPPRTLEACTAYALSHSPELVRAGLDEQLAGERVREVRSAGLPQVALRTQVLNHLVLPTTLLPSDLLGGEAGTFLPVRFGTRYSATGGVEASQLLYSPAYFAGLKAARVYRETAGLQARQAREEVVYQVSSAWYQAQISATQLEIMRGNLQRLDRLAAIARVQYEGGVLKRSDADRLRVNRTNAQTGFDNLNTTYRQQVNLLKFLMGMPVTDSLAVEAEPDASADLLPAAGPAQSVFARRVEYQLLDKQREMYHLERKRTQAGYWPTLSAFGNYQYQAFRPEFSFLQSNQSWYRASVVGVTLDVPLFDGLRRQAQMRQSYLRMKAAESQAGQLQESIALELENATARLENARAALRQQRDNRQLAEQVYAQVQLQYKTGVTPLADLLNAETDLQTAQNNYVQALIQLKLSALQLRKINGSLTETR